MTKKQYLYIGAAVAAIVIFFVAGGTSLFGSAFQVPTSQNPTGYYQLQMDNPCGISNSDLNFNILIFNSVDNSSFKLSISDGKFNDSGTDISNIYYAANQSYVSIQQAGFKTVFIPIECGSVNGSSNVNDFNVVKRASNSQVQSYFSYADTSVYNYTQFNPDSPLHLIGNSTYDFHMELSFSVSQNNSYWCGEQVNVTNNLLGGFPIANKTGFNTDANMLIFNSTLENVTMISECSTPFNFTYESQNYTVFILPTMYHSAKLVFDTQFSLNNPTNLKICVFDGYLDYAFDQNYQFYKIGGF